MSIKYVFMCVFMYCRLQASLLEHFDSGNYVKLCKCFEDILKKDPTCSDSLSRLVLMHRRGTESF